MAMVVQAAAALLASSSRLLDPLSAAVGAGVEASEGEGARTFNEDQRRSVPPLLALLGSGAPGEGSAAASDEGQQGAHPLAMALLVAVAATTAAALAVLAALTMGQMLRNVTREAGSACRAFLSLQLQLRQRLGLPGGLLEVSAHRISTAELGQCEKQGPEGKFLRKLRKQPPGEIVQLLLLCSFHGYTRAITEILPVLALLDRRTGPCVNALLIAAGNGREEVVQLLVEQGVDVNARSSHGCTALLLASSKGHAAVVRLLLAEPSSDVNVVNSFGQTALTRACECGDHNMVALLLRCRRIDVALGDHRAVRRAAECKHASIVLRLLQSHGTVLRPALPGRHFGGGIGCFLQNAALTNLRAVAGIILRRREWDGVAGSGSGADSGSGSESGSDSGPDSGSTFWKRGFPLHMRAYVMSLAFGNRVLLVGPARSDLYQISKMLLDLRAMAPAPAALQSQ